MITIRKARLKDYSTLMNLQVTDEQKPFMCTFGELWENRTPDVEFFVVNEAKDVLGFFLLDKSYTHRYTFSDKGELGLRNFVIGKQHQRKGHAQAALKRLFDYIYNAYPDYSSIGTIISKKNNAAYQCCLKAGFKDTGVTYYSDHGGQQYVMRKKIS